MENKTIAVTFSTLAGRKTVLWTMKEALTSDLADQVKHLLSLAKEGVVGIEISHSFYGRVNLDITG